ncbi:MAG: DUF5106 domain-containing protein [Chitinophagaceae bacterium]|nr:DUF5106 domain-containing protein [Chitinophagaceae bacterium]
MMKQFFLALVLLSLAFVAGAQNTGYSIPVTLKPYKNQYVYLGYYYGKLKALADSALLNDKSEGVFKGTRQLPGGIYFLVSPSKSILFELLLDKQQKFSIKADSALGPDKVVFTGSPDNILFQSYSISIAKTGQDITALNKQLAAATSKTDSTTIVTQIQAQNKKLQQTREDVIKQYPNSILAAFFKAMKEPVVPPLPTDKKDSLFAYRYFKSHFWDGVSFTDERLLRTPAPIFEGKIDKYFKELVAPEPDSIKKEVDAILLASRSNKEMYKYLLIHFIQKYVNPEYMGQDAVFVHIFEKYVNDKPEVDWFTEKYKKYIYDRAYSLMANLIGQPASNLEMVDTLDKPAPLYNIAAPYTVICFWDATCSHCKELVPHLDSMFQNKWKQEGIQLYGVMTDGGKEAWVKYIRENGLKDWIHVYQTTAQKDADTDAGKPSYKQLYDVYQTPVLYLLDKDKRILAKKLTYLQIEEVLKAKTKKS